MVWLFFSQFGTIIVLKFKIDSTYLSGLENLHQTCKMVPHETPGGSKVKEISHFYLDISAMN